MQPIRIKLWGVLAGFSLLWIAANMPFPETFNVITVRNLVVQYSGVLSIGAMSVAMMLAVRSQWVDRWLNGLDKSYRLHKWLGISALVTSILHWVGVNGPKWAVSLGLLEAPNRQRPAGGLSELGTIQTLFNAQRGTAEMVGEWAFYAAVALIAVALIKRIPYRFFAATHTLIALAYVALVFHAVILLDFEAWTQPLGIVTALFMLGGVVAAVMALGRQIGRSRRVTGQVTALRQFPSMKITEAEISLKDGWRGHKPGQFAFVTFDRKEGAHPFTIASAWDAQAQTVTVISKALGDYTALLPDTLSKGDTVTVEGPYGQFTFDDGKPRQIWIGAGIGITPFIARLKGLAGAQGGAQIDLIHTVQDIAPEPKALLEQDVSAAGVQLHLMRDSADGLLTADRLRQMLPDWADASIWFCGPAAFGQTLRRDLVAQGLNPANFHQELFNMR